MYAIFIPVTFLNVNQTPSAHGSGSVTYVNQLAFTTPQVENDKIVTASDFTPIDLGQRTTITKEAGPANKFTPPVPGTAPTSIVAVNETKEKIDIGVGFALSDSEAKTALVWSDVGVGLNVTAQFTPTLRAYITADYKEDEILRGAIQSPLLWEKNLAELHESTKLKVIQDPATGSYTINYA
ncbi:hypothetical protein M422DRAFT_247960 [Sphaerobolus stellatus SS14]|nr:hypothetical protein M422DRAFT_247960 [Sphaerobolus stellatus SS14]